MKKRDYTEFDFKSLFELDENSPSGLIWKVPRKYSNSLNYERVGKQAGNIREFNGRQKYWVVVVFNRAFFCHRIVWLLHKGYVSPENDIDHVDGDSLNNKLSNLREVPPEINSRNSRKNSGKELQAGIYYEELLSKRGTPLKRINAHYTKDGKTIKKNFSVLKYGYDEALALAIAWRDAKIVELNMAGAGYTERHGT